MGDGSKKDNAAWIVVSVILAALIILLLIFCLLMQEDGGFISRPTVVYDPFEDEDEESRADEKDDPEDLRSAFGDKERAGQTDAAEESDAGLVGREADVTARNQTEAGQDERYPYYTGPYNALQGGLTYSVRFKEEEWTAADGSAVLIRVEYPLIEDDSRRAVCDYVNEQLIRERDYAMELYEELVRPKLTQEEDFFECVVDSYVTYMDEHILSVVYKEELYWELDGERNGFIGFYCLNFDMDEGTLLNNMELLHIDEALAVDFREKVVYENGESVLDTLSDQQILSLLADENAYVIFYTPFGLEVGLNLEAIVIYVTYGEYGQFLNSF